MAQKDRHHDAVKRALIADGWTITHDPYRLVFGKRWGMIDIGAERTLGAQRGTETIAIEVKTFVAYSQLVDIEKALGQYLLYRSWLQRTDMARMLYLAISVDLLDFFDEEAIAVLISDYQIALVFVNMDTERIMQWRP